MDFHAIRSNRAKLEGFYQRFYRTIQNCRTCFQELVVPNCKGKKVLEIGCGTGQFVGILITAEIEATGIDISSVLITEAKTQYGGEFYVMDAEQLTFPDKSFDMVCGISILHHLNLIRAIKEITRVLKPNGRAIFIEPLGHNPFINFYRWLTPSMRIADEHPLRMVDIKEIGSHFKEIQVYYFCLTTLWGGLIPGVIRICEIIDKWLFRWIPFIRRYAWQTVIELRI